MPSFMEVCERAARAGGEVLLRRRGHVQRRLKGPKDVVTDADWESQQVIRDIVLDAYPDHLFLGEEDAPGDGTNQADGDRFTQSDRYRWIVDPLDGTSNYVHNLRGFAVSIALERAGNLLAGVVLDPIADECFRAAAGEGALLNGHPIKPSDCRAMVDALVAVSFSRNVQRDSKEIRRFVETLQACHSIRRLGSAALNLCYVASGRLDCYYAASVKAWDVAAGALILSEAGGVIKSIDGSIFDLARPHLACAATGPLHAQLLETLARAE